LEFEIMTMWFRTAILATGLAVAFGIGLASAAIHQSVAMPIAAKSDRLPIVADPRGDYVTIETRSDGVSVLNRLPRPAAN